MPSSPHGSSDSPPPYATPSSEPESRTGPQARGWRTNLWLFLATVVSVFFTHYWLALDGQDGASAREAVRDASQFTATLLGILLAHEFGHYVAARIHGVSASLPYFIPLPLPPFGTMGAVIRMRSAIPSRAALLDIGASGPLAGLVLAIPLYAWGVAHSRVISLQGDYAQVGDSLLLRLLDHWFAPATPAGSDVLLSPIADAAWAGLFVTMVNLIPAGQLDGGHVAYPLFGPRQNRIAQWVHRSMLAFFFVSLGSFVARDLRTGVGMWHLGRHVNNSLFWLVWFEVLGVLGTLSTAAAPSASRRRESRLGIRTRAFATLGLAMLAGILRDRASLLVWGAWFVGLAVLIAMEMRWGALRASSTLLDHPPTGTQPLRLGRKVVAVLTLAFFALLFMPTPIAL